MSLSRRQKELLEMIVEEYVKTAHPVPSRLMSQRSGFGVCPATIRNEMYCLTKKRYLNQPHTSAGRVPTDKGYRFFVDRVGDRNGQEEGLEEIMHILDKDVWQRMSKLSRFIAETTSLFALSGVPARSFFAGAGWDQVLGQPEFEEKEIPVRFAHLVRKMERGMEKWEGTERVEVFIGEENPFGRFREFSIVITECPFKEGQGVISLAGPKRMPYEKSIGFLKAIKRWLEKEA